MEETAISLWAIATIGGPIILGLGIAYGVFRNRRRRKAIERRGGRTDL